MEHPASSAQHLWWRRAVVVAGAVGIAGVAAAEGRTARLEVAALAAVTMTGFVVHARWPRMPTVVLGLWTFLPAIVLNLRERGEGTMFLLVVALSFLILVTPDPRTRAVFGTLAVLSPPAIHALSPQDWGWPFWMMGIGFGWLSSEQMRRFHAVATDLAATRELLARQAVHVERRRIAAELHDLVGHSLTVVLLSLTGARRLVRDDPDAATEALLEAEAVGRASLAEIRGSARALRDDKATGPEFAPMPAARDLRDLIASMVSTGCRVDLDIVGDVENVEPLTGLVVYRVVQESLNNAARHAPGASARVAVAVAPDAIDVDVHDAGGVGRGKGPAGVGLVGMRERVEAVGGTLEAGPVPGGWRVRAHVPRGRPDSEGTLGRPSGPA
ncbi:MAG TPA: histidine kinase [Acidimicrobiales bacterium]|nr:histidine kinase [Acidimicrobiales bacterium]